VHKVFVLHGGGGLWAHASLFEVTFLFPKGGVTGKSNKFQTKKICFKKRKKGNPNNCKKWAPSGPPPPRTTFAKSTRV